MLNLIPSKVLVYDGVISVGEERINAVRTERDSVRVGGYVDLEREQGTTTKKRI